MGPRTGHCASNPSTNIMTNMQTIVSGTAYSTGGKNERGGTAKKLKLKLNWEIRESEPFGSKRCGGPAEIALVIALAFDNISYSCIFVSDTHPITAHAPSAPVA
jgi:hypothetical protein